MINPFRTPFAAIFQNEVRLNSKRVAPYFMALLCAGNALLWWARGPARGRGWAVNADFFIAGALPVYSFMTLHLFTALFMADPVSRDFRGGIDQLIFSKPISRAAYLLGKFFGNFFVLVCCQSAFVVTWFVLQAVPKQGVITQDWKVFPYIKHFIVFVAISHLFLAAVYFTVGALTRNAKIVYGLGVCFYPVYAFYQAVLLKGLPQFWRVALDPLVMNYSNVHTYNRSAEWLNQLVIVYSTDLIINRAAMILLTAICLTILYSLFTITARSRNVERISVLNLSTAAEGVYYPESSPATRLDEFEGADYEASAIPRRVALPEVGRTNKGIRARLNNLLAVLGVEFRLLLSERSLVVIIPLSVLLSTMEVIFWSVRPETSYSAGYVSNIAGASLLFLIGISIFYTVEALHRDRDLRIESLVWTQPIPSYVLLLSKFMATLLLTLGLLLAVGLIAISAQIIKQNWPIELTPYLRVYFWILIPNAIFLAATAMFLKMLFRDRYLTYAAAIGIAVGLFYLYSQGHTRWLYNPLLFKLWSYPDLVNGGSLSRILGYRLYILTLSLLFIVLAHYFYPRPSKRRS